MSFPLKTDSMFSHPPIKFNPRAMCACGRRLHYKDPNTRAMVEVLILAGRLEAAEGGTVLLDEIRSQYTKTGRSYFFVQVSSSIFFQSPPT